MAGNMWEWTTETGNHQYTDDAGTQQKSSTTYAVIRGGSFGNSGASYPVSYRDGDYSTGNTDIGIGFRVVLYLL